MFMFPILRTAFSSSRCFLFRLSTDSMGSHWKGVQGFGTKEFTESVILPILPARRAYLSCTSRTFSASAMMASTSSRVSVGRPRMK